MRKRHSVCAKDFEGIENGDILALVFATISIDRMCTATFISKGRGGIYLEKTEEGRERSFVKYSSLYNVYLVARYGTLAERAVYQLMCRYARARKKVKK